METASTEAPPTIGSRGGVRWSSVLNLMREKGYDEESFAAALSSEDAIVTARSVDSWIRGQRTPTLAMLENMADVLNVKPGDLLNDRPRKKARQKSHKLC